MHRGSASSPKTSAGRGPGSEAAAPLRCPFCCSEVACDVKGLLQHIGDDHFESLDQIVKCPVCWRPSKDIVEHLLHHSALSQEDGSRPTITPCGASYAGQSRAVAACGAEALADKAGRSVAKFDAGGAAAGGASTLRSDSSMQAKARSSHQEAFECRGNVVGCTQGDLKAVPPLPAGFAASESIATGCPPPGIVAPGCRGSAATASSNPASSTFFEEGSSNSGAPDSIVQPVGRSAARTSGFIIAAGSGGSEEAAVSRRHSVARPASPGGSLPAEGAAGFSKLTRLKGDESYEGALSGRGFPPSHALTAEGAPTSCAAAFVDRTCTSDSAAFGLNKTRSSEITLAAKSAAKLPVPPVVATPYADNRLGFSLKGATSLGTCMQSPPLSAASAGTRSPLAVRSEKAAQSGGAGSSGVTLLHGKLAGDAAKLALAKDSAEMRSDFVRDLLMSAFEL